MNKFGVYDNDKPASGTGFPRLKGHGWSTHQFPTFQEAQSYARQWLGAYSYGAPLELNQSWDYSGYGDMILIKEEP